MACALTYTIVGLTGDCMNLDDGGFEISIVGSAPGYSIQWLSPFTDVIVLGGSSFAPTPYIETNLSAGTYTFNIIDSCTEPGNTVQPVSIYISSGVCVSVDSVDNTLCHLDNGSITARTEYDYGHNTYYLYHNTLGYITSANTMNTITPSGVVFQNLTAGTYYVEATDGGGCTGVTTSVIVQDSSLLNYGIYIVNDAGCNVNSGKLFVTGLTGNPPYTYLWSNGETTDSIENLVASAYDVTVSDRTGCVVIKSATVVKVPQVGQAGVFISPPACFGNNGVITVVLSGGTPPFFYSGSNGNVNVTFDNFYEFNGLSSGQFNYFVQDSGLCSFTNGVSLLTPQSFNIISINTINSKCGDNLGQILPLISNGSPPYDYVLTPPSGNPQEVTTELANYPFTNLSSGIYNLSITDGSGCQYSKNYEILNEVLFTFDFDVTGTTCGGDNGIVDVTVVGGTGPFLYEMGSQSQLSNLRTKRFQGLDNGSYTLSVTDTNVPCKQSTQVFVDDSVVVDFITSPQNPTGGNDGQIQLFIISGQPPFTYDWSENVGEQTGLLVTSLSAGTYTIKITDDNGCVNTKTIILEGVNCSVAYEIYNFTEDSFNNTGELIKKGQLQMLNEGFNDLTLGDDNCVLNESIFEASVSVAGVSSSVSFYTGHTLSDVPSNTLWASTIRNLLLDYDGIGNVTINNSTNKITISTDCTSEVSLLDSDILVNLIIHYDISCVSCELSCDFPLTDICDGYELTQTMSVQSILDPSVQLLELYDGSEYGEPGYSQVWRNEPKIVNVTSGCLNSYWENQDPPITDPEDINNANRTIRDRCLRNKNELALALAPFTWANNFIPSFQINKFF
jgi:hypothetical protein